MSTDDFYSILRIIAAFFTGGLAILVLFWLGVAIVRSTFHK